MGLRLVEISRKDANFKYKSRKEFLRLLFFASLCSLCVFVVPLAGADLLCFCFPMAENGKGPILSVTSVLLIASLLFVIISSIDLPSLSGHRSPVKPYATFWQFYPYYQSEHTDRMSRLLHFTGTATVIASVLVFQPKSMVALIASLNVGYILSFLFMGLSHGFFEFGGFLLAYLLLTYALTGTQRAVALSVGYAVIGYAFAWVGHFVYEGNRPATFIYPTYSLMGDGLTFARILGRYERF